MCMYLVFGKRFILEERASEFIFLTRTTLSCMAYLTTGTLIELLIVRQRFGGQGHYSLFSELLYMYNETAKHAHG